MMQSPDVLEPSLVASSEAARRAIRRGEWRGATAALAAKWVQAHVVILPASLAEDFRDFCLRNAQACPLLAVSEPGQAMLPSLGDDIDIRADLPAYQVWREGELKSTDDDIVPLWRRDLVTFVFASAFSYEQALVRPVPGFGLPGRAATAPTYLSQVPTTSVGPFGGPLRVAMRPLRSDRLVACIEVATRLGEAHGTPVHVGDPALVGIHDLSLPEQGEALRPAPDELPVFWASAVTAQAAARRARPALCITNAPGRLLVTDLSHQALPVPPGPHPALPISASDFMSPAAPRGDFGWR